VDIFHWIFIAVFVAFTAIRAYFHRQATRSRGEVEFREGRAFLALRLALGIPFILSLFLYMFRPDLFSWARLPFPTWLQWVGAGLGLASLPLIWWIQWTLGSNFSTTLHVRQEHTLVESGPYRWVRHPMYTALFLHLLAILLLTKNLFIGGVLLFGLCAIVAWRIRHEEAAMVDKFGDLYVDYMRRTGRFLPRWVQISR
jgi:protein-S-isoprenylcysteine O-methyltransferase Ste14